MKNYILIGIIIIVFVTGGIYIYQKTGQSQQTQQNQEEKILDMQFDMQLGCYIIPESIIQESQQRTGQSQQNQEEKILDVQLELSAPFSRATLLIDNQGTISYEASSPMTGIDKQVDTIKITEQEYNDLANLIIQNNFWSYEEQYIYEDLKDATTYTVRVKSVSTFQPESGDAKVYSRVYSVSCYGICPEKIVEIINKIKELWGKEILEVGI